MLFLTGYSLGKNSGQLFFSGNTEIANPIIEVESNPKINITDENLLEKTGGIIQGMSGTPIIQNGKFVGAITHVLVNNPTVGYAVFGDLMLKY